ncbi:MAG: methyltransferase domain-containing protein [Victivallales bacterium]|jgi:trans-aconitate 2-methyltransferase|nr:methyltransferase domain-containing protein [Victivallales bacterium]
MTNWNAEQYLKYRAERTQPSLDLVRRVTVPSPRRILDLGCGPGNSTAVLREAFPQAETILGVDSSADMVARARHEHPELEFAVFDVREDLSSLGEKWDVIFSNACLHWIPDHRRLLPRLMSSLSAGGQLAVQVPVTKDAALYKACDILQASEPWKGILPKDVRRFHQLETEEYCDVLASCAGDFTIWETIYHHVMPGLDAVIEWYRGSGLRPYLEVLPDDAARQTFIGELSSRLGDAYPRLADGRILMRFPRLFVIATASEQ